MTISGYNANYFNDKDKRLYVATQILSSLVVKGGIDSDRAVTLAIKYTDKLMKKLEEKENSND